MSTTINLDAVLNYQPQFSKDHCLPEMKIRKRKYGKLVYKRLV